jgi:formylglycine-generating enzyme required for sulfatase activity
MYKMYAILLFSALIGSSFVLNPDKVLSKKLRDTYQYVPSGIIINNEKEVNIEGFYMMATEVSNLHYKEYLAYLKRIEAKAELEIAQVRIEGWQEESYQKSYFNHPAYENYPVVNITKKAAESYCAFLEETLNRTGQVKEGYKVVHCRLPVRDEWIMAAQGGKTYAIYPWGGFYTRNAKGCTLANFNHIGTEQISYDQSSGKYIVVENGYPTKIVKAPSPVVSYFPNDFGLYNMSGNIAEMISDQDIAMGGSWKSTGYDIRIQSEMAYQDFSPEVGFRPVFQIVKK